MHELVIRGGTVVDGTGAPARTADVAVDDGRITAVGQVDERGERELDADGLVVAPGWVDIHTHYDGQVTWDPEVTPSSWHGVTTVVMGNCGVGFAPVRPGGRGLPHRADGGRGGHPRHRAARGHRLGLGELPASTSTRSTRRPRAIDIAAQVPHAALRAYVMGERAHEREADRRRDRRDVEAGRGGLRAGACGISTSRTILHSSQHGLVPGTDAPPEELLALGDAIGRAGHGVFQLVSDHQGGAGDRAWLVDLVERTGATATYALAQAPLRAGRLARRARRRRRGPRRRSPDHPAGAVPAHRDALRPAVVAAPVHHPPHLPRPRRPAARRAGRPAARSPRCAPRCSPTSRAPATRSPSASCSGGSRSSRSATRPTTSRPARRASPASPSARAARRRRSSSTGCSSATARRSCSRRWPATSTTTTRRCAR